MTPQETKVTQLQEYPKAPPSWPVIVAGVCSLVLIIIIYFVKFTRFGSNTQETWGQFGDFVGGVVNPLIGLCTIWLLVGSLKQSHKALVQSHDDLEITREILRETQETQEEMKNNLQKQIDVAEQAKDFTNAATLYKSFSEQSEILDKELGKALRMIL